MKITRLILSVWLGIAFSATAQYKEYKDKPDTNTNYPAEPILPGSAALHRKQRAGPSRCREPWAAWRAPSEGVRSRQRHLGDKAWA